MNPALETRDLTRRFGDTVAVDAINLRVTTGEIYGFLGPNGAGKSTMVRMLTTLLLPSSGSATVAGFDVRKDADMIRLRIGVALQEAALDPKQTGRELLDLQGRLYGLTAVERRERLRDLLVLVDIGDAIDRRIGTYSGGMKRRLDLAAALVHEPEVLFLDEPTTGLDPSSRVMVWDEVRRLNEQRGTTIFLTTQYLEEADSLAGRVAIINKGRIVAEGTPADLKQSVGSDVIVAKGQPGDAERIITALATIDDLGSVESAGDEVVISVVNGAKAISPVAVALSEQGIVVEGLTLRTPTLDDVFLRLTGERMNEESP